MRTPNCKCLICDKPMYRRPYELAKVRHVACMEHRAEAQKVSGITEKQLAGLAMGREKGTNHRAGYKHREESKRKASASHKRYWREHPEEAMARGAKIRGEAHYRWNGGCSRLNSAIRRLTENRKWMAAVKARDGRCLECGATADLEAHHTVGLAEIVEAHGITDREQSRGCEPLWDVDNGRTLCVPCHYKAHGRIYAGQ
jgi:hypothetical protein